MRTYYIEHRNVNLEHDYFNKDYILNAENIDNLRRNLIARYVNKLPHNGKTYAYDGLLRIFDNKTAKYIGTLLFNKKEDGRAYWMMANAFDFYYPVSAKTGRISGEGMDYFRSAFKKRK